MDSFKTLIAQNEAELEKKRKSRFGEGSALPGGAGTGAVVALQKELADLQAASGSFASQQSVIDAQAAAQAASDARDAAQDAAIAAQAAQEAQALADERTAREAAAAAEEAQDQIEEGQTDAEQAAQDAAISSLQAQDTALGNAINTEQAQRIAADAGLDTRLQAVEAQLPDDDSALTGRVDALEALPDPVLEVVAGDGITVDNTDPERPVVALDGELHEKDRIVDLAETKGTLLVESDGDLRYTLEDPRVGVSRIGFRVVESTDGGVLSDHRGSGVAGGGTGRSRYFDADNTNNVEIGAPPEIPISHRINLPTRRGSARLVPHIVSGTTSAQWEYKTDAEWGGANMIPNGNRGRDGQNLLYPLTETATPGGWAVSSDRSPLAHKAVETTTAGNQSLELMGSSGNRIPVNSLSEFEKYLVGCEYRIKDYVPSAGSTEDRVRMYLGLQWYDAQNRSISYLHFLWRENTLTTLTADLNPGDTTVQIAGGGTSWTTATSTTRQFVICDWVDETGYNWGPMGYSRNLVNQRPTAVAETALTIDPWTGPAVPAGTAIRQSQSYTGTYTYVGWVGADLRESDGWQYREKDVAGSSSFVVPSTVGGVQVASGAVDCRVLGLTRPRDLGATFTVQVGNITMRSLT